jgi:hypothetical protein
MDIDIYDYV